MKTLLVTGAQGKPTGYHTPGARGNVYVEANHGFAGVLASSLQDSSPATYRLTSVRSGPLGIRHPCTQSSLLETSCFERPFAALSFAVCCNGSSYVTRPANTPA
jgi:hypothetical protein